MNSTIKMMNNNLENFLKLVSDKPSDLIKKLEWRQANQAWLDRSAAVAIKILSKLRFNRKANLKPATQKELAELMNVSPQQINKIVSGEENLTIETITKIEMALNITIIGEKEDQYSFPSVTMFYESSFEFVTGGILANEKSSFIMGKNLVNKENQVENIDLKTSFAMAA